MKSNKNNVVLIAGIVIGLAAISAVCFLALKKLFPRDKNKNKIEETGTESGVPCCTLEDVQPPPDPAIGSPAE